MAWIAFGVPCAFSFQSLDSKSFISSENCLFALHFQVCFFFPALSQQQRCQHNEKQLNRREI